MFSLNLKFSLKTDEKSSISLRHVTSQAGWADLTTKNNKNQEDFSDDKDKEPCMMQVF